MCGPSVRRAALLAAILLIPPTPVLAQSVAGSVNIRALGGVAVTGADVIDAPTSAWRVTGAGTLSGLALDATLATLPSRGLVAGAPPVLGVGLLAPLSLTPLGALRTDASATVQPVVLQDATGGMRVTVTGANALKVDPSGVTQPVSGTLTALQGGAPWTVVGTGVPGWPSPGIVSTQGVVGGTPMPVSGRVAVTGAVGQGTGAPSAGAWPVVPAQGVSFNTTATSGSNVAQTLSLPGRAGQRVAIRALVCYLSATGSATLTVSDGGTVILDLGAFTGLVSGPFSFVLPPGVWGSPGNPMTVNVGAAGNGVTTTCSVVADRS